MAELQSTTITGSATVSTTLGVTGTSTLGTTNMADAAATSLGVSGETTMTGNFKIASGSPSQYRICRQQSGTSGLVQWVDFAVYDTNGSTRLF
jgi:hypothetical protein